MFPAQQCSTAGKRTLSNRTYNLISNHFGMPYYSMQEEVYLKLGQLVAMLVVQGVSGLHVLNFSVYDYLFGMELSNIIA